MIYRYVGDGSHYPGIPARDLSDDDLAALSPEQQQDVRAGRVYRAEDGGQGEPPAPPAAAPEPAPPSEYVIAPPTEGESHE